nr:MAG TPA: hypothetical protein [Caudoviricetes sp.]
MFLISTRLYFVQAYYYLPNYRKESQHGTEIH